MGDVSGLLLLGIVAVPVILLVIYMRRPFGSGGVPRDSLAMKGKSQVPRTLGIVPNEAFDDQLRDKAADLPEPPHEPESD